MRESEPQQDDQSREWQKSDARILGQILAAQNVAFTLPDTLRIAEFYAQILVAIPGITACRVCLGGKSVQAGVMIGGICVECESMRMPAWDGNTFLATTSGFRCSLADQPGMQAIPIDSYQHHFGFFVLKINQAAWRGLYEPFISNLSSYVALILENRWQKDLLRNANDELERKVEERTQELAAANEALTASRHAAIDAMKTAVEARRRAEKFGADLQREIVEHKQAKERLKVSEERLRLTLEAAQIGIWDWDLANNRYFASPTYYTMLGYAPKEGPADRMAWMQRLHPDDKDIVLEQVNNVLSRTCDAYSYEARYRHADGSYRWKWGLGYGAEHNQNGKVIRMLGLLMDIDKRKQMEAELSIYREQLEEMVRERTAELEQANKELDAFAYSVSHDLRSPLRHIDGFIGLLQVKVGNALDEQSRRCMDAISDSANKMGLLIDELLSFSRMGRQAMSYKQMDLESIVHDVICELAADTAGKTIQWHIGNLPAVSGDAAMLRIVLVNLIANAMKYTRPRQHARIEIGSLPGQNSEVVFFVRDNGVGFDMAYVDKLFGVFQRLHRADEFEGTGIGLATVHRIISRHGGRIWAESKPDQGATFFFALPQPKQE